MGGAGFDARRLLPPGAYDIRDDPFKKTNTHPGVKPRETPERPPWPRLSGRSGAGLGAVDARRGLRWLRRLSSRGRPGQVSAGAGQLRARGAGLGAGRRGCGCARAGEALPAAPGPAVPGGAEDRGCAVRGVPGLQAGPRPQRLSVTGAFAEVGAAVCAPRSGASGPRSPLLPAHSSRPLPTRRAGVAGTKLPVHGADSKLFSSRWPACHRRDCPRSGVAFRMPKFGERLCRDARWGWSAAAAEVRCSRPPGLRQRRRARSPASQCNLGCVSLEATYALVLAPRLPGS